MTVRRGEGRFSGCGAAALACLLVLAATASCIFGETQQRRFYTLVRPAPTPITETAHAGELWVREVQIASVYDRPQIVFRHSPTELRYFPFETWADRPQRMMNQHVVQALRASGLFQSVLDRLGTSPPTWVLHPNVEAMEQLDGGDVWYAHLAMSFRLTRWGEDEVLLEHGFSESRPLNDGDVSLTIRALSEILDEELGRLMEKIDARLSGREPPPRKRRPSAREAIPAAGGEDPELEV
ncbi:MAG: ABC-type transport auxiliary lipoprotein family protein, partial [Myxococcota bacterium]